MMERVGQQLGNYRLTRLLGQGGFAEVYLGEHIYLKTKAAVKVLQARLSTPEDMDGFLKEAQLIAHLSHPHIVRILDFGVDGQTPFLVMDYASNGTVREQYPRGQLVPLPTVVQYVKQVADALQYAHEERLIHRDIKPENMLLGRRNDLLLSDFGIALISQSSRYQSTQDVIGTVAYMSPEQIQGKPRPASDQYSLGIVVFEWLSGTRPFHGSFTEMCTQHMFAPIPSLQEKVPTISSELDLVVSTALAKDPKHRFASIEAFATALEQASRGEVSATGSASSPLPPLKSTVPLNQIVQPADSGATQSESFISTNLIPPSGSSSTSLQQPPQQSPLPPIHEPAIPQISSTLLPPSSIKPTQERPAPVVAINNTQPPLYGKTSAIVGNQQLQQTKRNANVFAIIGICTLIIALIGGSVWYAVGNNHSTSVIGISNTPLSTNNTPLSATASSTSQNTSVGPPVLGKNCTKVGVLLPETAASTRWESHDKPLLTQDIEAIPGVTVDYYNAQGDATSQQSQADTALAKGDCILVVAAADSSLAATIVTSAKARQVPVIAYDRLIESKDLSYYVSFDPVKVGELQGEYIANNYKSYIQGGNNVVMINGSQTDNNATLFYNGALSVLQPLYGNGSLKKVYDNFTPNWDNATAQTEMEGALTANANNIQIAYVANDGMANSIIAALKAHNLNGKVLVTGQDATLAGIQNIIVGDQSMTVYKPLQKEAQITADLVKALHDGTDTTSFINGSTVQMSDGSTVPAAYAVPIAVDKTNIQATVIADGYYSISEVCQGLPTGAGGIC